MNYGSVCMRPTPSGDARRDEKKVDDERRKQWMELRNKIIDLRKKVQPDGSLSVL
jgi:hypothetical protein